MEDIIEEVLGTEIEDETDYNENRDDNQNELLKLVSRRNIHLARLQLLNKKFNHLELSNYEIEAIALHLITNEVQMKKLFTAGNIEDFNTICMLVKVSPVLHLKRFSVDFNQVNMIIYVRNIPFFRKLHISCIL